MSYSASPADGHGASLLDPSSIDIILISNYHNIAALPYITEYTPFKGKIYATAPTVQIGR